MKYGGFVGVNESVSINGVVMEALIKHIAKARREALKAGIEANMVAIDREFARVKGFPFQDFEDVLQVPDMICGLKVIFDDLPVEDHAFWVFRFEPAVRRRISMGGHECGGCTYWDGDDGRCRNGQSVEYMRETDDGCDKREDDHGGK